MPCARPRGSQPSIALIHTFSDMILGDRSLGERCDRTHRRLLRRAALRRQSEISNHESQGA
jgi:hypothetical protein